MAYEAEAPCVRDCPHYMKQRHFHCLWVRSCFAFYITLMLRSVIRFDKQS